MLREFVNLISEFKALDNILYILRKTVNTEVLVKICNTLKCDISDIMELTDERTGQ